MTITTFTCAISHNVLLLTERVRSNCLLQILWTFSTIDADSIERRHKYISDFGQNIHIDNKEYAYVSGGTNLYIYVSSEVADYVFSTIIITTFRRVIPQNVSIITERVRSNCFLQILWTISKIDVDSIERIHRSFVEMLMSWFAASSKAITP